MRNRFRLAPRQRVRRINGTSKNLALLAAIRRGELGEKPG